jgi:SAM-dependent methyltransferase
MKKLEKYVRWIPRPFARWLRNRYLDALDVRDRILRQGDDLTPPRSLHHVGDGDFHAIGNVFLNHFIELCKLRRDEAVLDIGCGTGRMAIPLLDYLDSGGRYLGFDISRKAIHWCRAQISARRENFSFVFADIRNDEYNPRGTIAADEYEFPCDDASIDFAFATSVFTHMRRSAVANYLDQIHRSLRPGGRAMLSFFIIDEVNRRFLSEGKTSLDFREWTDDTYTIDLRTPERAIAYSEELVVDLCSTARLQISHPIFYGSWSGRPGMLDTQDVVVVTKN